MSLPTDQEVHVESNLDQILFPMLERVERTRQTLEAVRTRSELKLGLTPRPQPVRRAAAASGTMQPPSSAGHSGGEGAHTLAQAGPEDGDAVERIERERARARVARAELRSEAYRRRLAALARGDAESYVSLVAEQQLETLSDAAAPLPRRTAGNSARSRSQTGARRTPSRKKPATARKSPAQTPVRGRGPPGPPSRLTPRLPARQPSRRAKSAHKRRGAGTTARSVAQSSPGPPSGERRAKRTPRKGSTPRRSTPRRATNPKRGGEAASLSVEDALTRMRELRRRAAASPGGPHGARSAGASAKSTPTRAPAAAAAPRRRVAETSPPRGAPADAPACVSPPRAERAVSARLARRAEELSQEWRQELAAARVEPADTLPGAASEVAPAGFHAATTVPLPAPAAPAPPATATFPGAAAASVAGGPAATTAPLPPATVLHAVEAGEEALPAPSEEEAGAVGRPGQLGAESGAEEESALPGPSAAPSHTVEDPVVGDAGSGRPGDTGSAGEASSQPPPPSVHVGGPGPGAEGGAGGAEDGDEEGEGSRASPGGEGEPHPASHGAQALHSLSHAQKAYDEVFTRILSAIEG